jgi:flagellar FliJ protein
MKQPSFRLQRLLDLKEKHEQAMAAKLGVAERQAQVERASQDHLTAVRMASAADLLATHDMKRVGELRPLAELLDRLDEHLDAQGTRVANAERVVADAQRVLNDAHRDRRVLDRLREKHVDRHRHEAQQADQKTMDDIALARFLRSGPSE